MAGFIGNVVEWYDFALYGYMATFISTLFFPGDNRLTSLLSTYGVFAAGFIMRPLGSAVFGWLGDTIGRTKTMLLSVSLMAVPTLVLGCLPTYKTVGLWAPVLLVIVRLVQGLSVGGEFSSSVTYLVETAPDHRRGFSGSWANMGSMVGMLLGSGAAAVVDSYFDHETVLAWAWRLPFLVVPAYQMMSTELVAKLITRGDSIPDGIEKMFDRIDGSICLLMLHADGV